MAIDITSQINTTGLVDNQPATAASAKTPIQNLTTVLNNLLNGGQDFEILRGVAISDPAAQALKWLLYFKSDGLYVRAPSGDGGTVTGPLGTGGGGGAPTDATYIVQTANGSLSNEQVLGALATGLLKNTTTTGVLSIAANTDIPAFTGASSGSAGTTGGVAAPSAGDQTKFLRGDNTWQAVSGSGGQFAVLREEQAQNTAAGGSAATTWTTRVLNTEVVDANNIVTLAANQFTPISGTYRAVITAPFIGNGSGSSNLRMRLQNITAGTTVRTGPNTFLLTNQGASYAWSVCFAANGSDAYAVQYYVTVARATNGLGAAINEASAVEIYTEVLLEKLA